MIQLLDYVARVELWQSWAVAPGGVLGEPLAAEDGRSVVVPTGSPERVVLVAVAENGTRLAYWRMTVAPGERVSVA